ncbi:MAG: energy transducer TonB [Mediterranea sp.]|jgi:TonB family protein|nr:energy transducer TonB [Mediterranea sp.]
MKRASIFLFVSLPFALADMPMMAQDVGATDFLMSDTTVYHLVDSMPEFPGGEIALLKYLNDSVRYPVGAADSLRGQRVSAQFIVDKDGSVRDIHILRGIGPSFDAEAIRLLRSMPRWTPGTLNGEAVNVTYSVPIKFGSAAPSPMEDTYDNIYELDRAPAFPGGHKALMHFLATTMRYPRRAAERGEHGRVIVRVTIDKEGRVGDIHVVRSVSKSLDKEAIRVVKAMPQWIPGEKGGVPVNVRYMLPLTFRNFWILVK